MSERLNIFEPITLMESQVDAARLAAVASLQAKRLPDTELAPLRAFSSTVLLVNDQDSETDKRLKRLTLTLALVFNDLKDIHWLAMQLRYGQPPPDVKMPDAYAGQWNGMSGLVHRLLSLVLVEMMKVLEANLDLFEADRFKRAVATIAEPKAASAWSVLIESLRVEEGGRRAHPLARFLRKVRNKTASHYGHDEQMAPLSEGYRSIFQAGQGHPATASAFASLGNSMEQTRFYFADAAVTTLVRAFKEKEGASTEDYDGFLRSANYALRFVVASLLEQFQAEVPTT